MANAWIEETLPQTISTLTTQHSFKSQFSALTTNADRVRFCQAQKEVQNWIGLFVSKFKVNPTGLKCSTTAGKFREKGNDYFREHKYESAIQLYSRAICFAPQTVDNETASELALAFGNRSAAYFQVGQYENALKDIDDALALGYGEFKSVTKLQLRKCDCLIRLGRASEAKEFLNFMQKPKNDENDTKRWIELFGRISLDDHKKDESKPKSCDISLIEKLTNKGLFHSNEKMSSFSTKVAVQYDEVKGRHLVAQEDIEFGDILAFSQPYVSLLDSKVDVLKYCLHCCRDHIEATPIRPVPCIGCSSVVYCSEECRTESVNSYHRYECGQHDLLVQLSQFPRMSLRLLYRAGMDQICSVIDSSENENHLSEQAEGHYSHVYQLVHHSDRPLKDLNISYDEMLKSSILACLLLQLAKNGNFPMNLKEDEKLVGGILLRHLLQSRFNAFAYSPLNEKTLKVVPPSPVLLDLYPLYASTLNHSCKANARLESANAQSVCYLQAARPISAGTEITIPYLKEVYGSQFIWNIREKLWNRYSFHCNCTECAYLIRNMPFGISKQNPYYRLSCSKCSNLMERISERGSKSEIFRCTACPLEMANAEVKRRYNQINQLLCLYGRVLPTISELMMTDDNGTWKYFKSIIDQLGTLLHLDSTGQRMISSSYLIVGQFDKWWACNERFFSTIEFLYGTESVQFFEDFNELRNIYLEEYTFTEHKMECFKLQNKELYERFLARLEQWEQLKLKYYLEY